MPQSPRSAQLHASVCIPTRNRPALLLQTLETLDHQSLPAGGFDVVVADDGSTNDTLQALDTMETGYRLSRVQTGGRGTGAARNAAAAASVGEVLVFLDDDQLASPELVEAHLEVHSVNGAVLVQGFSPMVESSPRRGTSMLYERSFRSTIGAETAESGEGGGLWGMNISVRRETWADVGGFDEGLRRGQDLDFGLRVVAMGVPLVFEPRALSEHMHAASIEQFRRQHFEEGRSLVKIARKHGRSIESLLGSRIDRPFDKVLRVAWRRNARAAEAFGLLVSAGVGGADRLGFAAAQIALARLLRRCYEIGGISVEGAVGTAARG
jgi:glycosyltransferase involved in cell wall biosynthesis